MVVLLTHAFTDTAEFNDVYPLITFMTTVTARRVLQTQPTMSRVFLRRSDRDI
jgi:hypothetical protein